MKKIIPFKKDIIFKTNLAEIVSISLEHTLSVEEEHMIKGNFLISGEYKMLETSVNTDPFSYDLPFVVDLDERYILDKSEVDIDDFYYEIINDNVLSVHIDVVIDGIEEKEIKKEEVVMEEKQLVREELPLEENRNEVVEQQKEIIEENKSEVIEQKKETVEEKKKEVLKEEKRCIEDEEVSNIFNQVDSNETYKSYTIYIVRENDSIESIIEKYGVSKEQLEIYNDLSEIKLGDKIIIPS